MSSSRRTFLKNSSRAAAALGIAAHLPAQHVITGNGSAITGGAGPIDPGDPVLRELAKVALDEARRAGASYADVRFSRNRSRNVFTRERRVQGISDNDTFGFGVRALVEGTWGFAASSQVTRDEVARVARQAVTQGKANRVAQLRPVQLAPADPTPNGEWKSPIQVDPFTVAVEDKIALLLAANEAALKVRGARFVNSSMFFLREEKTFANTDGTFTAQTIYRVSTGLNITAVSADNSDFQSLQSYETQPMGLGYEYVTNSKLVENAPRWADLAVQKLSAKPVDVGRYDLVLHPSHLGLTLHEAIAHPTELDRAYGFEANYAGTSFVAPPEKVLGKFRYGPEFMNVVGDRHQPGSLSAVGWDDEGVKPEEFHIIKAGLVNDYQTTREQAMWLDWWYKQQGRPTRSHGCSYAQSWADVQFQRMPNVSLLPGEKDLSFEDLIAATDRGIAIVGDGSFSIDQQRYNAQFGGQLFYEIRGGKVVGMLKDVAYQIQTPVFWNAIDMIGGKSSYMLWGAFGDGKGQPAQSNAISHGCPPTRHRQINVINTGRQG
ncbi:MAG: TldD/PmbA family protein [Gemmatimonadetes bacterium]|nr:TldD/PmbA family protein [Gemmatimonadota bacterium]